MTTAQVHPQHLRDFCYAVLADAGLAEPANVALSEHLLLANLMGVDSHGLQQLPGYVRSLNSGRIRADAEPRLETSAATAILHVDANGAAGHYAALRATEWLIERAQETGIAIADLEGDGTAEILVGTAVLAADGTLRWRFPPRVPLGPLVPSGSPTTRCANCATAIAS